MWYAYFREQQIASCPAVLTLGQVSRAAGLYRLGDTATAWRLGVKTSRSPRLRSRDGQLGWGDDRRAGSLTERRIQERVQTDGRSGSAFGTAWHLLQTTHQAGTFARLRRAHRPGKRRPRVPRAEQADGKDVCSEGGHFRGQSGGRGGARAYPAKRNPTQQTTAVLVV